MPPAPSLIAAATALADWSRERQKNWRDIVPEVPEVREVRDDVAVRVERTEGGRDAAWRQWLEIVLEGVQVAGDATVSAFERSGAWRDAAIRWLMRGAALASTMSVLMVLGLHRGDLMARWDRVTAMVVAAANRPADQPPPPQPPPSGSGRLLVACSNGAAQVLIDGTPHGMAPVTIDVPAGPHRVLLRSEKGSVERVVRIQAGEPVEVNEAIFPGWLAVTSPIELTLSESARVLRRDERGWAILAPGPHDVHLDNAALGVHETRHVVVTPGDTTRISFAPEASTISLTTNEPADVWIDGAPFGQSPLVDQPIALGVHDIRMRSAAHERWLRVRATVQPVVVNVDLTAP